MSDTNSNPLDGKARMIELLHSMSDAARPEGIFERLTVQRLVGAWWHYERFIAMAIQRSNTDDATRLQKNALRWEACYNRAMRELHTLQTARALLNPADQPPPMANIQQLQHFAKRTTAGNPKQNPDCKGGVTNAPTQPVQPAKSTLCETKSTRQPEVGLGRRSLGEVGRNSPCPCGSGQTYKRCCGVGAPPILNNAA